MKNLLVALILPLFFAMPVSAHSNVDGEYSTDGMMESNMTDMMIEMEDAIMGDAQHERMEKLMDKMFKGSLTANEQQEMIDVMRDPQMGPGVMTMLMRRMNASEIQNDYSGPWGMMGSNQSSTFVVIAHLLLWILIALGVFGAWKWINKKK